MNKEDVQKIKDKLEKACSELIPSGVTLAWSTMDENLEWQELLNLADSFLGTFPKEDGNEEE